MTGERINFVLLVSKHVVLARGTIVCKLYYFLGYFGRQGLSLEGFRTFHIDVLDFNLAGRTRLTRIRTWYRVDTTVEIL